MKTQATIPTNLSKLMLVCVLVFLSLSIPRLFFKKSTVGKGNTMYPGTGREQTDGKNPLCRCLNMFELLEPAEYRRTHRITTNKELNPKAIRHA